MPAAITEHVFRKSRLRMNSVLLNAEIFTLNQRQWLSSLASQIMTPESALTTRRSILRAGMAGLRRSSNSELSPGRTTLKTFELVI